MNAIEQLEKLSREAEIHAYESRYIDREPNARLDARFEAFQEALVILNEHAEKLRRMAGLAGCVGCRPGSPGNSCHAFNILGSEEDECDAVTAKGGVR